MDVSNESEAVPHRNGVPWSILAVGVGYWLVVCRILAIQWNVNPQYSYGWLVPLLGLFLVARRWISRPEAGRVAPAIGFVLLALGAIGFAPAWLLAQPAPEWRMACWTLAVSAAGVSLGLVGVLGGNRWMLHFAIPILFMLTAVPWPTWIEKSVVNELMGWVANATVSVLNVIGVLALQHGNLIEIRSGLLGVDEACSGVRSLQATLMATIFLGEMYRFSAFLRAILLIAGAGIAFLTNICRTTLLGFFAARDGLESVERFHDPAGFTVATVCFLLVWGVALLLARNHFVPAGRPSAVPSFPRPVWITTAVWLAAVLLFTEIWFRSGPQPPPGPQWNFAFPQAAESDFRDVPIAPAAAEMLGHNSGAGGTWTDGQGRPWVAYNLRWEPSAGQSRILARLHKPENCLPSAGWRLLANRGVVPVKIGDLTLPFQALQFAQGNRTAHVWFCLWEERPNPASAQQQTQRQSPREANFDAVFKRERGLGQQVLEAALLSPSSAEEADAAFTREIAQRIHIGKSKAAGT